MIYTKERAAMGGMIKIQVCKGVSWVEVPEAGLRLLCGCPADVVKHLMKRGLIVPTEKNGVLCETGPNAIVLSDLALQGGCCSNLAEFPVLQMLYLQGMMIPGHPNNTGAKPILVGSRNQVQAQMAYIYRGNYGLVSEEEIRRTGVSEAEARQMMRMKLRFAFGKIRASDAFLESRIIERDPVEIVPGVMIERLHWNIFKISSGDESVVVDLNLPALAKYDSPYPLGFYHVKQDYFSIIHSGDGDGWDPNRPSMSSIIVFQGKKYLVDAGPNILNTLIALGIGINEIEGIFHTHAHDDHFAGLTDIIRGDRRLKYYATPLVRVSVMKKLAALLSMEEDRFHDFFEVYDLEVNQWNEVLGLEVMPINSPHPVETTIFIFRTLWEGGYCTYGHFADIVSLKVLEGMITEDPTAPGVSQETYDQVVERYRIPVNLKKLDVGGGMIHGRAEDFRSDGSDKLILTHTARTLTAREREIGSGAPFGTIDCLIPDYQNYLWRYAFDFLTSYFPQAKPYQLKILLNNKVVLFNPESIIFKEGEINREIYLVLTGNVEAILEGKDGYSILYAGSFLGEMSGIYQLPTSRTYRALSYVQALRIPADLYSEFIKKNEIYAEVERLQECRNLMLDSWLLGEGISYATQNRIAQTMVLCSFGQGQRIEITGRQDLLLLRQGVVEAMVGAQVTERLERGDFCNEGGVLFGAPGVVSLVARSEVEGYWIPASVLTLVPIVKWKLLEVNEKRMRQLFEEEGGDSHFLWRDEFSVWDAEMDNHHKKLFAMGARLAQAIKTGDRPLLEEGLVFLIDYTRFHFQAEEQLLQRLGYPNLEQQHKSHERLMEQIVGLQERLWAEEGDEMFDFISFFKGWIVNHILVEDLKYRDVVQKNTSEAGS